MQLLAARLRLHHKGFEIRFSKWKGRLPVFESRFGCYGRLRPVSFYSGAFALFFAVVVTLYYLASEGKRVMTD